jgi:hypothetical protein
MVANRNNTHELQAHPHAWLQQFTSRDEVQKRAVDFIELWSAFTCGNSL